MKLKIPVPTWEDQDVDTAELDPDYVVALTTANLVWHFGRLLTMTSATADMKKRARSIIERTHRVVANVSESQANKIETLLKSVQRVQPLLTRKGAPAAAAEARAQFATIFEDDASKIDMRHLANAVGEWSHRTGGNKKLGKYRELSRAIAGTSFHQSSTSIEQRWHKLRRRSKQVRIPGVSP